MRNVPSLTRVVPSNPPLFPVRSKVPPPCLMKFAPPPPVMAPLKVVVVPVAMSMRPPKLSNAIVRFVDMFAVTRSVDSAPNSVPGS